MIKKIIFLFFILIILPQQTIASCVANENCLGQGLSPDAISNRCSSITTKEVCNSDHCCNWWNITLPAQFNTTEETTTNTTEEETDPEETSPKLIIPDLQIKLPNLVFSDQNKIQTSSDGENTFFYIPWIGEYLAWLYNYSIGIIAVLALIAIMVGGFYWLLAGGNASRVTEAKNWINAALSGLGLALGSYLILVTINSSLVRFPAIKLATIDKIDIDYNIPQALQTEDAPEFGPASHGVPTYYQCSSYAKSIMYPNKSGKCQDNLCTAGCGILSTFMAINRFQTTKNLRSFTQEAINYGARETYSGGSCNGSTQNGLIPLVRSYGLKSEAIVGGASEIGQYLNRGCVVVISVGATGHPNCKFTSGGHFIVLTGWRDKSRQIVDVNDPFGDRRFPNKGDKTWVSMNDWGGCRLSQKFSVCQ